MTNMVEARPGIPVVKGYTIPETLYLTAYYNQLSGLIRPEDAQKILAVEYLRLLQSYGLVRKDIWRMFLKQLWKIIERETDGNILLPDIDEVKTLNIREYILGRIMENPKYIKYIVKKAELLEKSRLQKVIEQWLDKLIVVSAISTFILIGGIRLIGE